MHEFLKEIGITDPGHFSAKGNFIIDIPDDKTFGKYYSILDKSDLVEESEDDSVVSSYNTFQIFLSDKYQLTLISDFDTDKYQLVVREIK